MTKWRKQVTTGNEPLKAWQLVQEDFTMERLNFIQHSAIDLGIRQLGSRQKTQGSGVRAASQLGLTI